MTASDRKPKLSFSVELGPTRQPLLKISINGKEFPLELTSTQAIELGRGLFAASFAATIAQPPEGTPITSCELPVSQWRVGTSSGAGVPILGLHVAGGAELTFRFDPRAARACGTILAEQAGKLLGTVVDGDTFQFK